MRRTTFRIAPVFLVSVLLLMAGHLQSAVSQEPSSAVAIGSQGGEGIAEGFVDVLVPLHATEQGLWILNPRGLVNDNDEQEINIGVLYRHLLPDRNVILGGNIYYDSRWTRHNNQFDQLGLGIEVLSEYVDGRANYYLPESGKERIDSFTDEVVETSTSRTYGDPYRDGGKFIQKGWEKTYITTTTILYERFEQAREGWDCEVGTILPVPQDNVEARVFAGYYHFDGDFPIQDDTEGWKARLEVRMLPNIYLDAQVFEDKELNGSDWLVGGRASLPCDFAKISEGGNPFEGAMAGGDTTFNRRMMDMVIRDLAIRTEESGDQPTILGQSTQVIEDRIYRRVDRVKKCLNNVAEVVIVHED